MPSTFEVWTGRLPADAGSWAALQDRLDRQLKEIRAAEPEGNSPYRKRFRQGATVVPRVLFLVEQRAPGPLGLKSGTVSIRSVRSAKENRPWKDLDSLEGVIESEFVYRLYMGEHVLPYRTLPPARAVVPWYDGELLYGDSPHLELFPRLATWWRRAEELWEANRTSDRLSLIQQLDYHRKLSAQFPIQASRVVYAKSGMHLAAARIEDRRHVIDHTLYWATAASQEEALFLCAVLNTAEVTKQVRPFMSYGKDERHIDKHIWRLPIPEFNAADSLHAEISALAAEVERKVQALQIDEAKNFVPLRRQIRDFLEENAKAKRIEILVAKLLASRS